MNDLVYYIVGNVVLFGSAYAFGTGLQRWYDKYAESWMERDEKN
jgi:hypothetical protein